jgi:hypothetical protein
MTLSRRAFLRGAGSVAISLPLLEIMGCSSRTGRSIDVGGTGEARAAATGFPARLVVMFSANGTIGERWRPSGGELDFVLSPILAPLAPHREQLLILDGLDLLSARHGPGDAHQKGMGQLLSGIELQPGTQFVGNGGELAGWGGGITIDQLIAGAIGASTKFKSLELAVQPFAATVWSRLSYAGPGQPIPPEDDPAKAFTRLFGELGADPFGLERQRFLRHSILDAVGDDYARLATRVGQEDRIKIDAHLAAIRDIEARLDTGGQLGGACAVPPVPGALDLNANDSYPAIGKLQTDLLVMALTCDLTRVASLQWSTSVSNRVFTWLASPASEGHHDLSHRGDSDVAAIDFLTAINTWYAQRLADLCTAMKAVPEGDGTLLDHTTILWCNELGRGNNHSLDDAPFVLAGGACGALRTGRYLRYDGDRPHNDLLVSLAQTMGLTDVTTFGNPAYCTGPLPDLT